MYLNNKEVIKITSYRDIKEISDKDITIPLDIHIYQNVSLLNKYLRISEIIGIVPYTIYTISDTKDLIDFGVYPITWREEDTDLTIKYRKRFPKWFKYHIQIKVPNRVGLYYHIGNKFDESDGCEIVGRGVVDYKHTFENGTVKKLPKVISSATTYELMYKHLKPLLDNDKVSLYLHIV